MYIFETEINNKKVKIKLEQEISKAKQRYADERGEVLTVYTDETGTEPGSYPVKRDYDHENQIWKEEWFATSEEDACHMFLKSYLQREPEKYGFKDADQATWYFYNRVLT